MSEVPLWDDPFRQKRATWFQGRLSTLEATQGQISSQSPTDATSKRCYLFEVAFVWELTKETIHLPLGCLQGGPGTTLPSHLSKTSYLRFEGGIFHWRAYLTQCIN